MLKRFPRALWGLSAGLLVVGLIFLGGWLAERVGVSSGDVEMSQGFLFLFAGFPTNLPLLSSWISSSPWVVVVNWTILGLVLHLILRARSRSTS